METRRVGETPSGKLTIFGITCPLDGLADDGLNFLHSAKNRPIQV
jgi:hypothetical protein